VWRAHQREIGDGLIALLPFQIATSFFTFLVPVASLYVSQIILYTILRWSSGSFFLQFQFSAILLVASLQLGRTSCVWLRGDHKSTIQAYVAFLLYSLVFNGLLFSTNDLPDSVHWMFTISIQFWGIGGSLMTLFDKPHYINDEQCSDMLACLFSDGNSTVRQLGFAPMVTAPRALVILLLITSALFLLEYIGLWYHWSKISLCRRRGGLKCRINKHSMD
jgi:hypothetical protein